jgi:hypothetical protein
MTHIDGLFRDHKPERPRSVLPLSERSGQVACGCGCGEMIPVCDDHGRPRTFAKGHHGKVRVASHFADTWSEDRKNRFRTLWLTGRTCQQIADEMDMPRNSCPGRAQRMGLPGRGSPITRLPNMTKEERRKRDQERQNASRRKRSAASKPKRAPKLVVDNSPSNAVKPIKTRRVPRMAVELGESRNLLIGELTRETCAYPTSTEPAQTQSGALHKFCGNPVEDGHSFCSGHLAICFPKSTVEQEEIAA